MARYLQGDDELRRKLKGLQSGVAKAAIRKGTRAGAKIVQAEQQDAVPEITGTLRRGIKVKALPRSRKWFGSRVVVRAVNPRDPKAQPYQTVVNYGGKRMTGDRALNIAAARAAQRALDQVATAAKAEIERQAAL